MQLDELKKGLFASNHKLTAVITGGGSFFFPLLMEGGGSSALLVNGLIPYGHTALHDLAAPWTTGQRSVSQRTVDSASLNVDKRSNWYEASEKVNHVTMVCSATLKSEGERKDRVHRAWVSFRSSNHTDKTYLLVLDPKLDRFTQERELASMLLTMLAEYCGVLEEGKSETKAEALGHTLTSHTPMTWAG